MSNQGIRSMQGGTLKRAGMAPGATLVRGGVTRPAWSGGQMRQKVVLVLDCSPSMEGEKAREASAAALAFVQELAGVSRGVFEVAIVEFAGRAKVVQPFQSAGDLVGRMRPIETGGMRTNVSKALSAVEELLATAPPAQAGKRELHPTVFLMSDGAHNGWFSPDPAAARVKAKADLVTVAFGADAEERDLRRWATSPQHFYRVADGRELRRFLGAAATTLTGTMAAGHNATQALTGLGRQ